MDGSLECSASRSWAGGSSRSTWSPTLSAFASSTWRCSTTDEPTYRRHVPPKVVRKLANVAADHEAKESIITRSNLDWTIVRSPRLTHGPLTGAYRHGSDIKASSLVPMISRADVADFMLRQLDDRTYLHKAPAVMY